MGRTLDFIAPLAQDFRVIVSALGAGVLRVTCSGRIDHPDASAIVQSELLRFHEELIRDGVERVEVDLQDVESMNSSGLKGFIAWFLAAESGSDGAHYEIHLIYDPEKTWQLVSLTVMEKVAPRSVRVRTMAGAA